MKEIARVCYAQHYQVVISQCEVSKYYPQGLQWHVLRKGEKGSLCSEQSNISTKMENKIATFAQKTMDAIAAKM